MKKDTGPLSIAFQTYLQGRALLLLFLAPEQAAGPHPRPFYERAFSFYELQVRRAPSTQARAASAPPREINKTLRHQKSLQWVASSALSTASNL